MLWLMISSVFAYDPSVAQGHTGILTPITSAPAPIATTDAENAQVTQAGKWFFVPPQMTPVKVAEWLFNT